MRGKTRRDVGMPNLNWIRQGKVCGEYETLGGKSTLFLSSRNGDYRTVKTCRPNRLIELATYRIRKVAKNVPLIFWVYALRIPVEESTGVTDGTLGKSPTFPNVLTRCAEALPLAADLCNSHAFSRRSIKRAWESACDVSTVSVAVISTLAAPKMLGTTQPIGGIN